MFKTSGKEELSSQDKLHEKLSEIQGITAFMPDYNFKAPEENNSGEKASENTKWPAVDGGTSAAGIIGGVMTLVLAGIAGFIITLFKRRKVSEN